MALDTASKRASVALLFGYPVAPVGVKPGIPQNVVVETISSTSLKVSWGFVPTAEEFEVHRANTFAGIYVKRATITNALSFTDTGLVAETTYYYKVLARNQFDSSDFSVIVSGVTSATVETDIWKVFWDQLTTDVTLLAYVGGITHFKEGYQSEIKNPIAYPIVVADLKDIQEETWIGVPKRKRNTYMIEVVGKVKNANMSEKISVSLKLDRLTRNAIESDLTLGGEVSLIRLQDTNFTNTDDGFREGKFMVEILSKRFTAGNRYN